MVLLDIDIVRLTAYLRFCFSPFVLITVHSFNIFLYFDWIELLLVMKSWQWYLWLFMFCKQRLISIFQLVKAYFQQHLTNKSNIGACFFDELVELTILEEQISFCILALYCLSIVSFSFDLKFLHVAILLAAKTQKGSLGNTVMHSRFMYNQSQSY